MATAKDKYLRVSSLQRRGQPSDRPSDQIEKEWKAAVEQNMGQWREQKQQEA